LEVIYGDYNYIPDGLIPEASIELTINPIDLTTHWQRCGVLSDMIAAFISCAYPEGLKGHQSVIFSSISTIFQELIENAARHSRRREASIRVRLRHYNRVLRIEVQNEAAPGTRGKFEAHIRELLETEDLDSLYVQLLEDQVADGKQGGIGLLLMLKDYPIKLGVRFGQGESGREVVIVRVYYQLEMSDYGSAEDERPVSWRNKGGRVPSA